MRTAHKVWSGIAAGVFCLVAISDLSGGDTTTTASSATPADVAVAAPTSTTSPTPLVPSAPTSTLAAPAATAAVARVVDGDSIQLSDGREVQLVGLDACDVSSSGGRDAKASLESYTLGTQVQLVPAGSRDADAKGRLLRRLETVSYGTATDVGSLMVALPAVGVEDGQGTSPDYLAELRAHDYGPRSCSDPIVPSSSNSSSDDSGTDLDGPSRGDQGLPDGALTGGYCKKKWWC